MKRSYGYIKKVPTREYRSWRQMKQRCNNPSNSHYPDYGGRGVTYHPDWEYFQNFIEDMGPRPPKYTLERKDNNGDYTPENCKWASQREQNRNTRRNVWRTADGRTQIQTDWARELGVDYTAIDYWLKRGQTMQQVFDHFKNKE